jgi:hypothetical protein
MAAATGEYDWAHRQLREHWRSVVEAGEAVCHAPICKDKSRRIEPGSPWCLGHTADRTGWTGPEHRHCSNQSGLRLADARRAGKEQPDPPPWRSSQSWLTTFRHVEPQRNQRFLGRFVTLRSFRQKLEVRCGHEQPLGPKP